MIAVLIGGPADGRRVETDRERVCRVPRLVPMSARVEPLNPREETMRMEYDEYRIIRLMDDAFIGLHHTVSERQMFNALVGGYRNEIGR